MLRIKEVSDCLPITIELDLYTPIKIIFGPKGPWIEPTAYWRTGDLKKELIEIGVAEKQGLIRKITLVLIKKIIVEKIEDPEIKLKPGIPIFERINYDKNLLFDEIGPLEMFVDKNKLKIIFSHNQIVSGLKCSRVICLLDSDNNFCGIEVSRLTDKEMHILKENFIDR